MVKIKKPTIGIVGLGVLGGAALDYYKKNGYEVVTYDIAKPCTGKASFKEVDIIFICIPTPYKKGKCDLSALWATLKWIPDGRVVVIRSTIPPGTTDKFAKKYDGIVYFNPEFLDASKSIYDFEYPERQIIGLIDLEASNVGDDIIIEDHLPKSNRTFFMSAKEAECVKYMGNTFFAVKNVFANIWYDYCKKMGVNYDRVREAVGAEPRIGYVHLQVPHKGGRGAGGACLPKELAAAVDFMRGKGLHDQADLLEKAQKINNRLLKESGKTNFSGMYKL